MLSPIHICKVYPPMQLMMYVGNDLIEAVFLKPELISTPGYLGAIKRQLKEKYHALLLETEETAEFLVIHSMNEKS